MRIIGGAFGGRRLAAPAGTATRPSAARVREGVASALHARGLFEDARVLDLFAGSGALGFEALSRGARSLVAVDASPRATRSIADNATMLGVSERVRVVKAELLTRPAAVAARLARLQACPFTLVFADAPYARLGGVPDLLARLACAGVFAARAVVAVEHPATAVPSWPVGFSVLDAYRYGDTGVTLLEVARASAPAVAPGMRT